MFRWLRIVRPVSLDIVFDWLINIKLNAYRNIWWICLRQAQDCMQFPMAPAVCNTYANWFFFKTQDIGLASSNVNVSFFLQCSKSAESDPSKAPWRQSELVPCYCRLLSANTTDYTVPRMTTKYNLGREHLLCWTVCMRFSRMTDCTATSINAVWNRILTLFGFYFILFDF